MATTYNNKDIFIQRRTSTGTFEERPLAVAANSVIVTDSGSNLVMITRAELLAGTGSINFAVSSSYAESASYALNVPATASLALSASYLNPGANIYLSQSYIYANISASAPSHVKGQIWWDAENHTYAIDTLTSRLQIGQENYVRAIAGEYIPNGYAVFFNGTSTDPHNPTSKLPVAWLALADIAELSSSVVGLSTENISVGDEGFFTTQGNVNDLNTFLLTDSDILYLSTTDSGSYTTTIPSDPYPKVKLGTVLYSHPTIGRILVSISILPVLEHNGLRSIQGGSGSQYYHLTAAEYTGSGTGIFVRQSGSVITGSISNAVQSNSSSYIIPGATLFVVSSSTNPSYIEPLNIPTVPYNPPYKEGRMFYDKDYSNWVYYTDQNFKLHIGKEVIWRVYNATAGTLATGTPVYLSGSTNGLDPDVYPAIADGTNRYSDVVGVIRYNTPSGSTGYIIQAGVIHNIDMTGFTIGDEVFLSSTVLGGTTNVDPGQPYESVRIGYCQVGGSDGSFTIGPTFKVPPAISFAGITSDIDITSDGSGSIYVSTGSVNLYNTPTGYGAVLGYPLAAQTMSIITGSTNYVVAELSNSIAIYNVVTNNSYANGISIVRVAILDIYQENTSSWDVHQFDIGIVGLALANRINNKDISLYGYQRQDGLTLYTTGSSGSFGITEGTIWYGPNAHTVPTFDTTVPGNYAYIFHPTSSNGTASWHQHTSSVFLTGVYSSGSNDSFVVCAPLSWSVNFVYRLIGTTNETAIVLSSEQFATELEASNNATTPANLPSTIRDIGMLVGRFVVQSGSYSPTIESAFSNTFIPATVTNHESLLGLQGSTIGTGGGHYHLAADDYTGTGTGVVVRTSGATLTSVVASGSLYGTASVATIANSISFVPSAAISASWVSASVRITTADTASYVLASNIDGTVVSASNAGVANSISFVPVTATSASWVSASAFITTAQTASYVAGVNVVGTVTSASNAGVANSISFVPATATSASWVSASAKITTADTASYVLASNINGTVVSASNALSASWAPDLTVTVASASWASSSISSSNATTASYVLGIPTIKSGIVAGASFAGVSSKTASIVFTNSFPNTNYSVVVTGESSRTWTIQEKSASRFEINANSAVSFTDNVFWQAISTGEYYS